jgi:hypothetical protein
LELTSDGSKQLAGILESDVDPSISFADEALNAKPDAVNRKRMAQLAPILVPLVEFVCA